MVLDEPFVGLDRKPMREADHAGNVQLRLLVFLDSCFGGCGKIVRPRGNHQDGKIVAYGTMEE